MRDVMRYSGIVTKVAAMRAKLLKPQDYEQLASMNTVTDIIEYLKQTKSYGKFITQMDESLYHRGNIEKVLIQSLYDDYTRLYRFADMQQKDFLCCNRFTTADLYMAELLDFGMNAVKIIEPNPVFTAYIQRHQARESYARATKIDDDLFAQINSKN